MKLSQVVPALIDGILWDIISSVMENSPMVFFIVPYQYIVFPRYLEVGPFMSNFILPPVLVPCLWDDEELRCAYRL